jgi:copper chaperone
VTTARHTFAIEGMHCTSCAMSIDWELEDLEGVVEARTSYAKGRTEVAFDPGRVTIEQLVDAIARAGFTARTNA